MMAEGLGSTSSLSKGCFLFDPQLPKGKKRKTVLTGTFQKLPLENDRDAVKRNKAYTTCWTTAKGKIDAIIAQQHDKVIVDLLHFIFTSSNQLEELFTSSSVKTPSEPPKKQLSPRLEIPTAALIAGVNMPDHDVLFNQLRAKIRKEGISPYVVWLKSKDCNSGMKATMKELLLQLMDEEKNSSSDEEEGGGLTSLSSSRKRSHRSLPLCSMDVLCSWYKESCDTMHEQLKSCSSSSPPPPQVQHPPVVIIVEDFEGFVPRILQDLVLSLSPHLREFPVILVLGVATSMEAIHRTLPRAALSQLCIDQFHAQHSMLTLADVINDVLLSSELPFKLGPKALQLLLHQFFYSNFSLTNFTRGFQLAMMEHFYWQPLSVLCASWEVVEKGAGKLGLNHAHCEMIRATPSFQSYIESLEPAEQLSLLEKDAYLEAAVIKLLHSFHTRHSTFFVYLELLHHFTKRLPNAPLKRKVYELYCMCLEYNITGHKQFHTAWAIVNLLGKGDLTDAVNEGLDVLSKPQYAGVQADRKEEIRDVLLTFKQTLNSESQPSLAGNNDESAAAALTPAVQQETTSERKMRFQERLRQVASRKKGPSAFEVARTKLLDSLLELFKVHLVSPCSLPLHEVCYYDHVSSLRKHLVPAPRVALQTALSNPGYYLPSAGCVSEQSGLDSNMPDICIAYQLLLECGRLVNLYDWLQSFIAIVLPESKGDEREAADSEKKKPKQTKQDVDPLLHARFIQTVSELQFLGFIRPTQRKTDHVERLTWGAV